MLNASLARAYDLRLDNEQEMLLIARDLGFLPQGKAINSLILAPGERAEVLVNLAKEKAYRLSLGLKRGIFDKIKNVFSSGNDFADNTVLELRPQGDVSAFSKKMNEQFNTDATAMLESKIAQERTFELDVTNGLINKQRFDPRRVVFRLK